MVQERPLSPHLMIYRRQLTSMMSISHRLSGATLAAGSLMLVWWVAALASGPEYYSMVQAIMMSIPARMVLFGFTAAIFYHLSNGIRHLFWDFGIGLTIEGVYRSGYVVMASTLVLTLGLWALVLFG
ncbi:succinate dehydrogenase, cytochrome b556 subunit [Alphaproteobacteria bacterium LSUCC0684]